MKLIEACLNVNKDETNQVIFDSNFYDRLLTELDIISKIVKPNQLIKGYYLWNVLDKHYGIALYLNDQLVGMYEYDYKCNYFDFYFKSIIARNLMTNYLIEICNFDDESSYFDEEYEVTVDYLHDLPSVISYRDKLCKVINVINENEILIDLDGIETMIKLIEAKVPLNLTFES